VEGREITEAEQGFLSDNRVFLSEEGGPVVDGASFIPDTVDGLKRRSAYMGVGMGEISGKCGRKGSRQFECLDPPIFIPPVFKVKDRNQEKKKGSKKEKAAARHFFSFFL
jgi:hypothetical protein